MKRVEFEGVVHEFPDDFTDADIAKALAGEKKPVNQVTATTEQFMDKPPSGNVLARIGTNAAQRALPSTTLSDYWQGPLYAMRHPIDSAGLLLNAAKEGALDQLHKSDEAMQQTVAAPTLAGKLSGFSSALGHGAAAVVPFVGPAAANVGEQYASGDIAGGVGGTLGLLAPFGASKAAEVARPAVASALEKGNAKRMEQALAATTNENKTRAQRVAPQMVERGIWSRDLPTLEAKAAAESEKAGQAVGAELSKVANKTTDVLPLVHDLEKAKASAIDTNAAGKKVVIEPNQVKAIDALQDTLKQYGDTISVQSLNKVRLKWDEVVQASKGFTNPDVGWQAWAAREGRSVLRDELSAIHPDVDKVMAEYSFWQNIEDVAHATNKRRVGQNGSLLPTIAAQGGAAVGAVVADAFGGSGMATKAVGAGAAAKLAASLKRLVDSPGWKMFTAVQRQRIADAVASGNVDVIDAAARAGAVGNRLVGQTPQPTPVFAGGSQQDDERASR